MSHESPTAAETYEQHRVDIARVLDWLDMELDRHGKAAAEDPTNWARAGDLTEVRRRLIETLAFISGHEIKDIEELLDECRTTPPEDSDAPETSSPNDSPMEGSSTDGPSPQESEPER